jgi:hypothetical protein
VAAAAAARMMNHPTRAFHERKKARAGAVRLIRRALELHGEEVTGFSLWSGGSLLFAAWWSATDVTACELATLAHGPQLYLGGYGWPSYRARWPVPVRQSIPRDARTRTPIDTVRLPNGSCAWIEVAAKSH